MEFFTEIQGVNLRTDIFNYSKPIAQGAPPKFTIHTFHAPPKILFEITNKLTNTKKVASLKIEDASDNPILTLLNPRNLPGSTGNMRRALLYYQTKLIGEYLFSASSHFVGKNCL
jgi:hypothetical protein